MFKLTSKETTLIFNEFDVLILYVLNHSGKLFKDGAFIKISQIYDFCDDFLVEDLKK